MSADKKTRFRELEQKGVFLRGSEDNAEFERLRAELQKEGINW